MLSKIQQLSAGGHAKNRRAVMSIDGETGENDKMIDEGVFLIAPKWGEAGLAPYLYAHHTEHALINGR